MESEDFVFGVEICLHFESNNLNIFQLLSFRTTSLFAMIIEDLQSIHILCSKLSFSFCQGSHHHFSIRILPLLFSLLGYCDLSLFKHYFPFFLLELPLLQVFSWVTPCSGSCLGHHTQNQWNNSTLLLKTHFFHFQVPRTVYTMYIR